MIANKAKIIVALSLICILIIASVSVTFAWFTDNHAVDIEESGASVLLQYFHSGSGTQNDPYVITRPNHYRNLIMLYQENPEFEGSDFINSALYFRIGSKDLDNDGTNELTDFSVFNYNDNGTTDGTPSNTLNLATYTDGLYPIGTPNKPFEASFDGSGLTISNLKINGTTTVNNNTYKTPDIGVFGYVTNVANISNLYVNNISIDLSEVDAAAEYQSSGTDMPHINEHESGKVYVGYIAGHIITGAQVNNVYINNCKIIGGEAAECGFGYFGHVEDENGIEVPTLGSEIVTQRGQGDEAGFGGSLDMRNMLERLQNVWNNATAPTGYANLEYIVINENDGTRIVTSGSTANITLNNNTYNYRYYNTLYSGKYYYYQRDDRLEDGYQFMCMYGETSLNPKTVNTYTIKTNDLAAIYIKSGNNYLTAASESTISATTLQTDATKWKFDEDGHIYTYIDHQERYDIYYLNRSGLSGVTLSQTANTVWLGINGNTLYTTVDGNNYYLDYTDGTWIITSVTEYYSISDGNGHYLSCDNTPAVQNANSAAASVRWQIENTGNSYTFHTVVNDTVYYLVCDGSLKMSSSASSWTLNDGYFTKEINDIVFLLVHNGSQWIVVSIGKNITDGNGHYLSANSNEVLNSNNSSDATIWKAVTSGTNTQFYTIINSIPYYLSYNNILSVSQTPFSWTVNGDSYYTTSGVGNIYLRYNNGWEAVPLTHQIISNGNGHYLRATGVNTFTDTTVAAEATNFYFSGNMSGTIMYSINGTFCYLGASYENFADTNTAWVNDNGYLQVPNTEYYLIYSDGWRIAFCGEGYYTISSGTFYFNAISASSYGTGNGAGSYRNSAGQTFWHFSVPGDYPSGTIYTNINGTLYYLNGSHTDRQGCTAEQNTISLSTTGTTTWTNTNGVLQGSNVRLRCNNGTWGAVNTSTNVSALTITPVSNVKTQITIQTLTETTVPTVEVSDNEMPETTVTVSAPTSVSHTLVFVGTTEKEVIKTTQTNVNGGYQTYIPLRIADSSETTWYDASDPYRVSLKNTGYIISGARVQDSTTVESGQKAAGDIRISYFPISSISGSYTSNSTTFSNIYTIDSEGNHLLSTTSDVYTSASEQLLETLNGSDSVYGLHFMDSVISTDHLLTADKAVILGNEYDDYEMPLDSIDFRVVERGTISFFAGEYFTNNNAFFSLHQVFRDEDEKITYIKEIEEIYEHSTLAGSRPYIYRFTDGSYTDANGEYDATNPLTTLDTNYNSTPIFCTSWITDPTGMTSGGNKVYYFEIPCNKGEYCLGSVSEKIGAYLIYLDIATNGGDAISTILGTEGNDVTNSFKTDYRYSPDALGEDYYSVMLFSIETPAETDENSFSVEVNFTDDTGQTDFTNGIYTITVVNKSGSDLRLNVYLCDDNRDSTDDFLYAYRIIYTNESQTNQTIQTVLESDYWQSMASFDIPSTGSAQEAIYIS